MSATVNAELFQSYFEKVVPGSCGCVEIPGRTFPVAEYRLEDAIEATGYVCEPESGSRSARNPLAAGEAVACSGRSRGAVLAARRRARRRSSLCNARRIAGT